MRSLTDPRTAFLSWLNRPSGPFNYLAQTCAFLILSEEAARSFKNAFRSEIHTSLPASVLALASSICLGVLAFIAVANARRRLISLGWNRWYIYSAVGVLAVCVDALMLTTDQKYPLY